MWDMLARFDEIAAQPVLKEMRRQLLEEKALQTDETTIKVQTEGQRGTPIVIQSFVESSLQRLRELNGDNYALIQLVWEGQDYDYLSDAGLAHIKDWTKLKNLKLTSSRFTDEGLSHIEAIKTLKAISLDDTGITDEGMKHVAGLKKLKRLRIRGAATLQPSIAGPA